MADKINVVGGVVERIRDIGPALRRIEPAEVAKALGAEPIGNRLQGVLDPIALAELGTEVLRRLRSENRGHAAETAEYCRVPLTKSDLAALAGLVSQVEAETGNRPSIGELAQVIVRSYLATIGKVDHAR